MGVNAKLFEASMTVVLRCLSWSCLTSIHFLVKFSFMIRLIQGDFIFHCCLNQLAQYNESRKGAMYSVLYCLVVCIRKENTTWQRLCCLDKKTLWIQLTALPGAFVRNYIECNIFFLESLLIRSLVYCKGYHFGERVTICSCTILYNIYFAT